MKSLQINFTEKVPEKGKTKFGGQPDWVSEPEWPISKSNGEQMDFICQINLEDIDASENGSKMAYIFMTGEKNYAEGTWDPNLGENAVIIQPGENKIGSIDMATGPSLQNLTGPQDVVFEAAVEFSDIVIPQPRDDGDFRIINKIGGTPDFVQGDEYPSKDEEWDLLIQIKSSSVPFYINFGDMGVGYAFISKDRKRGKFLWQSS